MNEPATWPPLKYVRAELYVGISIAIFGVGQIVAGLGQWYSTEKQWDAMLDANKASIAALQIDQRAWLAIEVPSVDKIESGKIVSGRGGIRNSGKTPGRVTKQEGAIIFRTPTEEGETTLAKDIPRLIHEFVHIETDTATDFTVAPSANNSYLLVMSDPVIEPELFAEIEAGGKIPVILRYIEYRDVFEDKPRHSWSVFAFSQSTGECHRLPVYDHMD